MTAIILEDELNAQQYLANCLKKYCPKIRILGAFETVDSAFEAINELKPDIVFMDIELQGASSFELFEKLPNVGFEVIFTTAFDNYTIRAIRMSAVDYLLKPLNPVELISAVEKAIKRCEESTLNKHLEAILNNFVNAPNNHKMAIPTGEGFVYISIADIIYLESDGAYTLFYLKNHLKEKIMVSQNIKEYEDLLSHYNFFRIHKSHMINMQEIVQYVRGEGGYVVMSNNKTLDVSRRKKLEFLKIIGKI